MMRLVLLGLLSVSISAYADVITLTAIDSGSYRESGYHDPSSLSYTAGRVGLDYRNFFKFNLSGVSDTIVSASLRLFTHDVTASGAYVIYDANHSWLNSSGVPQYNDLGGGIQYGAATLNPTTSYRTVGFGLNGSAVSSLNAASGYWALGGRYTATSGAAFNNYLNGRPPPQLVLTTIPEPASIGLLGLVSGGIYFSRRFFIA